MKIDYCLLVLLSTLMKHVFYLVTSSERLNLYVSLEEKSLQIIIKVTPVLPDKLMTNTCTVNM